MLLGGLWHGAGWTYVIWGGLHGLFLGINNVWRKLGISLPKFVGVTVTFLAVVASWVLFRAATFQDALELLQAMAGMKGIILPDTFQGVLGWIPVGGIFQGWQPLRYLPGIGGGYSLIILGIVMLAVMKLPNTMQMIEQFTPKIGWGLGISNFSHELSAFSKSSLRISVLPILNRYMKKYERYFKIVLALILMQAVIISLFNIAVDPYRVFNSPTGLGVNQVKPEKDKQVRMFKAIEVIRIQPKMVFIGSSENRVWSGHCSSICIRGKTRI